MLTVDGRVKIVDFGLAKTAEVEPALAGGPSATQTAAGLIMGTVPYMSPEQARGSPADFRSDQFALGVMLYEMTTATHPFKRETGVQTLSAIIAEEPPDPAEVAPSLPGAGALADSPAAGESAAGTLSRTPRISPRNCGRYAAISRKRRWRPSPVTRARPRKWLIPAAGVALVAAGLLLGTALAPQQATAGFDKFIPFATDPGYQGAPTWSPDGKQIAYQAEVDGVIQIFTRTPGSPGRTQLTNSRFDCYISGVGGRREHLLPFRRARRGCTVSDQPGARRQARTRHRGRVAVGHFVIRQDGLFPPQQRVRDGHDVLVEDTAGREGGTVRARGPRRTGSVPAGICVSPRTGHACCCGWARPAATEPGDFWDIALPDGEPRAVMPGVSRPGLAPPFFSWLSDNRHVLVTRSDGSTPGNHLWVVDTRTRHLPVRRRGRARTR